MVEPSNVRCLEVHWYADHLAVEPAERTSAIPGFNHSEARSGTGLTFLAGRVRGISCGVRNVRVEPDIVDGRVPRRPNFATTDLAEGRPAGIGRRRVSRGPF